MIKRIITDKAPEALGTYSQGSRVANLVFTSGQVGINPITGALVTSIAARPPRAANPIIPALNRPA